MKDVLGLDLGTRCGWARGLKGQIGFIYTSGEFDLSITRFDSASVRGVKLKRNVAALLTQGVDHVFYEKVMAHKGVTAAHVYGGLMNALLEICDQFDVPCEGIHVGTIKKFATGRGNASKSAMMDAAIRAGQNVASDNEADAYWTMRCGIERVV